MPLFSVIIPLYNKENFIEKTLKSVLSQTFSDFELIIVNDGSTDKSEEKVLHFKDDRIKYFSKENEGVSATRNFGIEKASGKFISFIDADDIWKNDFLENMNGLVQSFPEQKVFSAAIEIQIENRIFEAEYSISKESPQIINYFEGSLLNTAICTSCAVFEKSVFETAGNFDTALKRDEDTDLWIRIGLKFPVVFSWKLGAIYTYDPKSLTNNSGRISEKTDFSKYSQLAKTNPKLEKFLDLNRFSFALQSKLAGEKEGFEKFSKQINLGNLNWKQRILLSLPSFALKSLQHLKLFLQRRKIRLSAFK